MIVDDERDVVTLIRFVLEKEGHAVEEAYNGIHALEFLGINPPKPKAYIPDLIILDVMMPMMDGYTTAAKLREDADTRSIPILILTAKGQMREVFEAAPNVKGYIEKPFDPKYLREIVGKVAAQPKN